MKYVNRLFKNVGEAARERQKSAKKQSLHRVNEHFEPIINAAMATQVVFQQPAKSLRFLLLLAALMAGGCAFNEREPWPYDGSVPVELAATAHYLPVQERDENGRILPYQSRPNPYTTLTGQIDGEAVTTYIAARRAFNAENFDQADELLLNLAEQQPKLSGPWVLRGDIARERGDLAEAVEHYVAAIEIKAINFNAWLRLAKTQRMRGHFAHAQNTYAKALALWPDGPELHLNLGVLYDVYLNQPLQAQAHMEAYQVLDGGSSRVAAWLEEIRQRTGVASTLKTVGPEGEVETASDQSAARDPLSSQKTQVQNSLIAELLKE